MKKMLALTLVAAAFLFSAFLSDASSQAIWQTGEPVGMSVKVD